MDRPLLTPLEGGSTKYKGADLMGEVYDLIRHRLPDLDPLDPHRQAMSAFLAQLGPLLGRSQLVAVPEDRATSPR